VAGGIAAFVTVAAVIGGVLSSQGAAPGLADQAVAGIGALAPEGAVPKLSASVSSADLAERAAGTVSRSDRRDRRTSVDADKVAALAQPEGPAVTGTESLADEDPRTIAKALLAEYGFGAEQFSCLDPLWMGESGWRVNADNPHSSAYGIPQALPGSKMSSAGADWATNPITQIRWGLGYIRDRYGSPCSAWSYKQGHGYY